jgi:hypothetical protein
MGVPPMAGQSIVGDRLVNRPRVPNSGSGQAVCSEKAVFVGVIVPGNGNDLDGPALPAEALGCIEHHRTGGGPQRWRGDIEVVNGEAVQALVINRRRGDHSGHEKSINLSRALVNEHNLLAGFQLTAQIEQMSVGGVLCALEVQRLILRVLRELLLILKGFQRRNDNSSRLEIPHLAAVRSTARGRDIER